MAICHWSYKLHNHHQHQIQKLSLGLALLCVSYHHHINQYYSINSHIVMQNDPANLFTNFIFKFIDAIMLNMSRLIVIQFDLLSKCKYICYSIFRFVDHWKIYICLEMQWFTFYSGDIKCHNTKNQPIPYWLRIVESFSNAWSW